MCVFWNRYFDTGERKISGVSHKQIQAQRLCSNQNNTFQNDSGDEQRYDHVWRLSNAFFYLLFILKRPEHPSPPLTDSLFPTRSCQTKYFMRVSHAETRDIRQLPNAKQPKRKEKSLTEYMLYMWKWQVGSIFGETLSNRVVCPIWKVDVSLDPGASQPYSFSSLKIFCIETLCRDLCKISSVWRWTWLVIENCSLGRWEITPD